MLRRALLGFVIGFTGLISAAAQTSVPLPGAHRIRIITVDFVLPGKLEKLGRFAEDARLGLDRLYVETVNGEPDTWLEGADLILLDTPRPTDLTKVQERLGSALANTRTPWVRIGGGPPAFGNIPPQHARRLIAYYAGGGERNIRAMFDYIRAWRNGTDTAAAMPPSALPAIGFYHSAAPRLFDHLDGYLQWARDRWKSDGPRVAFAIHSGLISGMETQVIDALIAQSEARGLLPLVFWFDAADPDALQKLLGPAKADVLVIATHLQNGPARKAEFLKLNIPVLQTVSYREGDPEAWAKADSGMSPRLVAPFLALPESWGVSDPMVIDAVRNGEPVPMMGQVDALLAKVERLATLRHKPIADKRLALMFWNYPPGEKNISASNLNVPRSLEKLTAALATAGYDVAPTTELRLIEAMQAMLEAIYHPERLSALLADGLADTISVARYRAWFDTLPSARRDEILARWGAPEDQQGLIEIGGEKRFVIPRLAIGKLLIMPQPPRSGSPGSDYHDAKQPPGHAYLAAYLYLREMAGVDALIHFGTHGTQEWTPGKDRGLSAGDYPYLAVGDLPVFYPYIQDNIAEAIQAKRRGRAVTVSHQTPPFAPAGLYDELRDLHARIHEYIQLDDGAVRDRTAADIRALVIRANLHRDMKWDETRMETDFPAFLSALHDHVHELARHAMPLGLHTFGEAASPEHRLVTVMQQLGEPFYRRLGTEPDELFASDFKALQDSAPYRMLHRHLRDDVPLSDVSDRDLRSMLERAVALDRHLAETNEIEALLAGLAGGFVAPGAGGDPIRDPDVPSGRNLFPFEPDKIPTRAAYEAGGKVLQQLIDAYRAEHNGETPDKLAFSLWSGETMRHLGVVEGQILQALGLRPVWNDGGRVTGLEIVPATELGRPRIDTVLQVTSVYRDQFDGFMRLLADAIARLAALDEPDNTIARNARDVARKLVGQGIATSRATELAALRLFSNEPGDYGTSLPGKVLQSTTWDKQESLADAFLARLQYAYGSKDWGVRIEGGNLFAEQLRGTQAAVLSRSSKLHGILSTDHPFEYLGGLSLAIRHLDGRSPSLYIADLREQASRVTSAARFLADEMRTRTLNPHWIGGMQRDGYAGTLELLNAVNNLWGWQVTDPGTVRADQWQAIHDTFIRDMRQLGLKAWFEQHNPTAQAQIVERMVEVIRKGYWDATETTRRELVERWRELADQHSVDIGEAATRAFVAEMAAGFGLQPAVSAGAAPTQATSNADDAQTDAGEQVRGQVLQTVSSSSSGNSSLWRTWIGVALVLVCVFAGAAVQVRSNARLRVTG
ncbi:cobaltochelatase subunit CobN [Pseudorhodoplanes sinuspersici]|uniref:Cobaltochelatase subunit CobN n=1 Tax=Pseudorhodoplanes sinuspersici TaxID=1235591 RepID=A0A1W6ZW66_9HYPH|nr:cobaltochelatase subunit CobN [Pseudorhodoplanes sinuspersici]ARQ01005.1 cobaltochelatase subunit CobN [Pseudorhodoplanes sinuspersici]RKE72642.1 cobaltochelatase CobN subunit [Pseudorhodoplanes sinuspersici]